MAAASAPQSPGDTSTVAPGAAWAAISGGPPASVSTAGTPLARASTATRPYGSGSVDARTNRSRSASTSGKSVRWPSQCAPGISAARARERVGEVLFPGDRATGDYEVGVGMRHPHLGKGIEQYVEALPRVDAAGAADEQRIVRDRGLDAESSRVGGGELEGIGRLGDHHRARARELIGDCLRRADHLGGEVTRRELVRRAGPLRTARRSRVRARRAECG